MSKIVNRLSLKVALVAALVMVVVALAGCASGGSSAASNSSEATSSSAAATSSSIAATSSSSETATAATSSSSEIATAGATLEDPTPENPIIVDKANGEIRYLAFVNGTYFTEDTRHGVVFEGGSNGDKSVTTGYGDEKEFYQACIDMGWVAGDNLTKDNMAGGDAASTVEGEKLDVTIRWDGQDEIPFGDVIEATNGETWTPDYRFGGNLASAEKNNTGCVLCLDSCATGIASDAYWPTGTTSPDNVTWFHGRSDVLPADGTDVVVTFRQAA